MDNRFAVLKRLIEGRSSLPACQSEKSPDSQSVKVAEQPGERGEDAGKDQGKKTTPLCSH